jgi:hypothetical protein
VFAAAARPLVGFPAQYAKVRHDLNRLHKLRTDGEFDCPDPARRAYVEWHLRDRNVAKAESITHDCVYPFASDVANVRGRPQLSLAASCAPIAERVFYAGALVEPELAAALLFATSDVALRRYYVPPAMVARILRRPIRW